MPQRSSEDLQFDTQKRLYKVIRERAKTGEALDIPIPKDLAKELLTLPNGNPGPYVFWNRQKDNSSEYRHASYMREMIAKAFEAASVHNAGHMISQRLRDKHYAR